MPSERLDISRNALVLLVVSVLTSLQLVSLSKIILLLLKQMKENSQDYSKEREKLLNRLMSRDPMTFQILSQNGQGYPSDEGEVRNNDEAEMMKTTGVYVDQSVGEPSFDFDMAEDLRELGIVQP
jgi:hypothetical protein